MELRKQSAWSEIKPEFFYWRTAAGQEVDSDEGFRAKAARRLKKAEKTRKSRAIRYI